MNASKLLIPLLSELALHAYHSLKAWVEERNSKLEQLRKLLDELLVHELENVLSFVMFLLRL